MKVNGSFLSDKSEQPILGFFLNENKRESIGENSFECIESDFFYNMMKSEDYWTNNDNGQNKGNLLKYYHFCLIPLLYSDNVNPSDPNPPNKGY
jgi:hypothetical protein